ncbi:alpha/beta hydrolase [Candidatus Heimdallarchaeota archaeon]|nr:MAG: alpha/beta hydrolase [Candidatus Gerdarchaeota archaeon]RLI71961.1 MAG: alpha/beta hydrolase [Candidatus Heimdallarchaeota archaeon]
MLDLEIKSEFKSLMKKNKKTISELPLIKMQYTSFSFRDHLGIQIFVYKWSPEQEQEIKGLICILHGMAEHGKRYEQLAEVLTAQGFVCYAEDHRGHGKTMEKGKAGWLYEDGMTGVIKDIHLVIEHMRDEYPNKPIFLFGHSWGSYLAQAYMQQFGSDLAGVILSGSKGKQALLGFLILILKIIIAFKGKDTESKFVYKVAIEPFNKPFKGEGSPNAWISSLEETVKKYDADPLCGFRPPNGYFLEMTRMMKYLWKRKNEAKIPKDLPILILYGSKDPTNNYGKDLLPLIKRYKKLGLDINYKKYENARHEIHNDLTRDEVTTDILNFLQQHT